MNIFTNLYKNIDNYADRRFTKVILVSAFFGIPIHLFSAFEFYNFGIPALVFVNIFGAILFASLIYLVFNKVLKTTFLLAVISVVISSFLEVYYVGWGAGYQYYILIVLPIFFMYTKWKPSEIILMVTLVFGSYFASLYVGDLYPVPYILDPEIIKETNIINFVAVFATFIGVIVFFSFSIGKMEYELTHANSKLYKSSEDNKILLKEIHHRVKNNLHVVNSVMELQKMEIKDQNLKNYIQEAQQRIISMATLHEKMYGAENMKAIPLKKYLPSLFEDLVGIYDKGKNVSIDLKCEDLSLGIDSLGPLTFLLNEIITNSFKHAFLKDSFKAPMIYCTVQDKGESVYVEVGDNGTGIQDNNLEKESESIGSSLIESFLIDLEANYEIENKNGVLYKFTFKKDFSLNLNNQ